VILNSFDVMILKNKFKKIKKYFDAFLNEKHLKKQSLPQY